MPGKEIDLSKLADIRAGAASLESQAQLEKDKAQTPPPTETPAPQAPTA